MEIIKLNNNHLKKKNNLDLYRCTCPVCGTEFKFTSKDVSRPRCLHATPDQCKVICPNPECKHEIRISDKCVEKAIL